WRVVVIGPYRDVAIRERIPMPAEAGHADMHLAAATNGWHIAAGGTVHDDATALDKRDLLVDREPVLQPHGAGRNRHRLTRTRQSGQQARHEFIILPKITVPCSSVGP